MYSFDKTSYTDIMYGGDGVDNLYSHWGDDTLIGGNGDDILDGGYGNDTYIYWKGQGTDTIIDVGGKDSLYLYGFSDSDIITTPSDDTYVYVKCNGNTIVKIRKKRGVADCSSSFEIVYGDMTSDWIPSQEWKNFKNITSIRVACPVILEIYDNAGSLVQTLENEIMEPIYTDYGNFYVSEEDGEFVKYAELEEGYSVKIKATDDGIMNFASYQENDNGYSISSNDSIPIEENEEYSVETSSDIVLMRTYDGTTNTSDKIMLERVDKVPAESIEILNDRVTLGLGEEFKIDAEITPQNSTEQIQFESLDTSVAEVDFRGTIIGVGEGTTYITVFTDSGVTSLLEVIVKEDNGGEIGEENGEEGEDSTASDITPAILSKIKISKTKTEYCVGDVLDLDDLNITAVYDDGTQKSIDRKDCSMEISAYYTKKEGKKIIFSRIGLAKLEVTYEENGIKKEGSVYIQIKSKTETQQNTETKVMPKPSKVTGLKIKAKGSGKISITWKKAKNATKYNIQIATKKNFEKGKKAKSTTAKKYTWKKLKKGKIYYVRVRGYNSKSKKYGKWSNVKKIKIR